MMMGLNAAQNSSALPSITEIAASSNARHASAECCWQPIWMFLPSVATVQVSPLIASSFLAFGPHHFKMPVQFVQFMQFVQSVQYLQFVQSVQFVQYLQYLQFMQSVQFVQYLQFVQFVQSVQYLQFVQFVQSVQSVQYLQFVQFVQSVQFVQFMQSIWRACSSANSCEV